MMMQSQTGSTTTTTTTTTTRRRRRQPSSPLLLPVVTLALCFAIAIDVQQQVVPKWNYYFMAAVQASPPASLHKTRRLGSNNNSNTRNNNNNNSGSGSLERVMIVQPTNLQSSNSQTTNSHKTNNKNGGGDNNNNYVILHQWPHPDDAPKMGEAMSDEDRAKFLYEVARFSQTQQQKGGVAATAASFGGGEQNNNNKASSSEAMMKASYSAGVDEGGEDTSIPSYEEWVAMQKSLKMKSTSGGGARSSSSRINMNAHGYYLPQQQFTSTAEGGVDSSSSSTGGEGDEGEAPTFEAWMAMQQAIPERQVILRPMSQLLDDPSTSTSSSKKKTLSVPALLGNTQTNGGQPQEPEVYYYDAQGLVSSSSFQSTTPQLTLPDEVYTASGQKLKLSDVHDGGRAEVYLEMNPKTILGKSLNEWNNSIPKTMSSSGSSAASLFSSTTTAGNAAQQSQDQMIVFLTVATMAIMVGMLSARRLRSRKFLEQCMTPDLEDDLEDEDVRYDKKFDGNGRSNGGGGFGNTNHHHRYTAAAGTASYAYATSGSGGGGSPGRYSEYEGSETSLPHFSDLYPTQSNSIMGSLSRRSGYGTNDGGMHWRGDMEKFDV
jgi:hypothetical protein